MISISRIWTIVPRGKLGIDFSTSNQSQARLSAVVPELSYQGLDYTRSRTRLHQDQIGSFPKFSRSFFLLLTADNLNQARMPSIISSTSYFLSLLALSVSQLPTTFLLMLLVPVYQR